MPASCDQKSEGLFNRLLAPGKLMEEHKGLEKIKCLSCHDPGHGVLNEKCLNCHKEIQPFVQNSKGFHGTHAKENCYTCHSDHKGRKFDSTAIDSDVFQHKDSGFELTAKHGKAKCVECHRNKRTGKFNRPLGIHFLGTKNSCLACHKKDDVHFFGKKLAKMECGECHGVDTWKEAKKFDHDKETRFGLIGAHSKVSCQKCHTKPKKSATAKYEWLKLEKTKCLSCHKDQHKDKLSSKFSGGDCLKCHNQTNWKTSLFNHSTTGFDLKGGHEKVNCVKCHTQKSKLFPLKDAKFTGLKQDCKSCHQSPHLSNFSRENLAKSCSACHTVNNWKEVRTRDFNHDTQTKFPLTGKHLQTKCADCHIVKGKSVYKFPTAQKDYCISCHENQHERQFSQKFSVQACSVCHSTENFERVKQFDHSLTGFKLTGDHTRIGCVDCHKETAQKFKNGNFHFKSQFLFPSAKAGFCVDCHENVHKAQFKPKFSNQSCLNCHDTEKFAKNQKFDHSHSRFLLKGKHKEVKCDDCHKPTSRKFPGKTASKMHEFQLPQVQMEDCTKCHEDYHKGNFGQKCAQCHQEESWKSQNDFHKNFNLSGIHRSLSCNECHKDGRRLAGLSQQCQTCHQKDDIHAGALPACGDCHRQMFWEMRSFNHSLSSFPLRGIHRTIDCASCHLNGVFQGTPNQCVNCHRVDALRFSGSPNHSSLLNRDCTECHNQFSFK